MIVETRSTGMGENGIVFELMIKAVGFKETTVPEIVMAGSFGFNVLPPITIALDRVATF